MELANSSRGRPPKYGRAARAVTITLPEDVLARLAAVDSDLGRAIVAVTERRRQQPPRTEAPAHLASYGKNAVIVVYQAKALSRLPGVQLVPIGNGRALISLDEQTPVARLELEVRDALDAHDGRSSMERLTLEALKRILAEVRRSPQIDLKLRTILVLEKKRVRRRAPRPD